MHLSLQPVRVQLGNSVNLSQPRHPCVGIIDSGLGFAGPIDFFTVLHQVESTLQQWIFEQGQ